MGLHHHVPHMEAGLKNAKWWHNNCFSRLTTLNGWHWSCCSLMTKNRLLLKPRFEELVPIEHRVHFFILFAKTPILLCRYFHYLNQQASSNMFWFLVQIITKCSTIDHKELKRHLPVRVFKCCICLLLPDFQNGAVWLLGFKSHTLRLKSSCSYWLMLKIGDGNNNLWELPSHDKADSLISHGLWHQRMQGNYGELRADEECTCSKDYALGKIWTKTFKW